MLLLVLPVCSKDSALAIKTLNAAYALDGQQRRSVLISAPSNCDISAVERAALRAFSDVRLFVYDDWASDKKWPAPHNWAWQQTARHIITFHDDGWLWWESDAVPLSCGWVGKLEEAWGKVSETAIMAGHIVTQSKHKHCNGVAIYRHDIANIGGRALLTSFAPFDVVLSFDSKSAIADISRLIGHYLKPVGGGPGLNCDNPTIEEIISSGVVLWHGCTDGSLQDWVCGKLGEKKQSLIDFLSDWRDKKSGSPVNTELVPKPIAARVAEWPIINWVIKRRAPMLIHCVERHRQGEDGERRVQQAQQSWIRQYESGRMAPAHLWENNYPRSAQSSLGDQRNLPYLKDVLVAGMDKARADDVIVWTNDDTILHSGTVEAITSFLSDRDAITSHRLNFPQENLPSLDTPVATIRDLALKAQPQYHLDYDLGRDLFACRKAWLKAHWHELPDFLLGECEFDIVLAAWVRHHAGVRTTKLNWNIPQPACELARGYVLHVLHDRVWTHLSNESSPAKQHNRRLANEWYSKMGMTSLLATK